LDQLVEIAQRVEDEYGDGELKQYLNAVGVTGIDGELKNLIFAADGPKPRIVLRDAVNNVIEIVKNAEHCLVFDRPLGPEGLTWQALVTGGEPAWVQATRERRPGASTNGSNGLLETTTLRSSSCARMPSVTARMAALSYLPWCHRSISITTPTPRPSLGLRGECLGASGWTS
jgi:hypothetical protein